MRFTAMNNATEIALQAGSYTGRGAGEGELLFGFFITKSTCFVIWPSGQKNVYFSGRL